MECNAGLCDSCRGCASSVTTLYDRLRQPPYGVRDGLLPIYLAAFLADHEHELACYEEGTFVVQMRAAEYERLMRAPERFSVQHYPQSEAHLRLLSGYVQLSGVDASAQPITIPHAVRQLMGFAARLPVYTRQTSALSAEAQAVRATLFSAHEPPTLLYVDLPRDVGLR